MSTLRHGLGSHSNQARPAFLVAATELHKCQVVCRMINDILVPVTGKVTKTVSIRKQSFLVANREVQRAFWLFLRRRLNTSQKCRLTFALIFALNCMQDLILRLGCASGSFWDNCSEAVSCDGRAHEHCTNLKQTQEAHIAVHAHLRNLFSHRKSDGLQHLLDAIAVYKSTIVSELPVKRRFAFVDYERYDIELVLDRSCNASHLAQFAVYSETLYQYLERPVDDTLREAASNASSADKDRVCCPALLRQLNTIDVGFIVDNDDFSA